jgi:hypothetical protein
MIPYFHEDDGFEDCLYSVDHHNTDKAWALDDQP